MKSQFILEMKGITKIFPGTCALDRVNFNLKAGEVHALLGENGAGKSTLMNVLMGIYQPNDGEIRLNGKIVKFRSPLDALNHGIGMVPQELNLVSDLSVAENIFMGREPKNALKIVQWKQMNSEAQKLLDRLHVTGLEPTDSANKLSAAFQQLVSIGRILASGSRILIFDEPTAALTAKETEDLFSVIQELKTEGYAFVFITHHLDEVSRIADRVTILRDGKFVHSCMSKEITVEEIIYYMANQKVEKVAHRKRQYSDKAVLKVRNFTRRKEFRDISFEVKRQEIFGIAGLVGSGRTELVNAIYGLTKIDSGELEINMQKVKINSPKDAMKLGIGYVTEERRKLGIFSEMSVNINMMLPSLKKFYKKGVIDYRRLNNNTEKYIDMLSIKVPSVDTLIKYLSGGNQQKVLIARWLENQCDLLIMDEPTRGIDVRSKHEIYQLIRKMADEGKTIIVISSETEELLSICDRIMIMHEGVMKGLVENSGLYDRESILKTALQ